MVVAAGFLGAVFPAPMARATKPVVRDPAVATGSSCRAERGGGAVTAGFVVVDLTANPKDTDATQIVLFREVTASNGPEVKCLMIPDSPANGTTPYAINQLARTGRLCGQHRYDN